MYTPPCSVQQPAIQLDLSPQHLRRSITLRVIGGGTGGHWGPSPGGGGFCIGFALLYIGGTPPSHTELAPATHTCAVVVLVQPKGTVEISVLRLLRTRELTKLGTTNGDGNHVSHVHQCHILGTHPLGPMSPITTVVVLDYALPSLALP